MKNAAFYDDLAELYDLIYENWPASIERQANVLTAIIRARTPHATTIADVACGIGTQSLGLAARGFAVTGSDLSTAAIARAKREAAGRNLAIEFRIDDMQQLTTYANASADVLIACDNAVPHLLDDDAITAAFRRFRDVLKPAGTCVLSVRDYAAIEREPLRFVPYGVRERDGERIAVFQVWEFEGERYRLNKYFVFDDGVRADVRVMRAMYYAITIDRLIELARDAGFVGIERIDGEFFQPLIVCRR